MDDMPCTHAMTAIKRAHMDPYEYCSIYYKKQTYLNTYEGTVNTVGNPDEWKIPEQLEEIVVEAPIEKCAARRPKKTRLPSRGEFRKYNIKCGKCGEYGHNKKTCRNRAIVKPKNHQNVLLLVDITQNITIQSI